jgi:LacI family transcriptional regulator
VVERPAGKRHARPGPDRPEDDRAGADEADAGRPVTLRDVAGEAGVSLATASRALSEGPRSVRADLRGRVFDAAAKLHYLPKASARSAVRDGSRIVSLVVSDLEDPYFSSIATGVIDAAARDGLRVIVDITRREPRREAEVIEQAAAQRSRALIFVGSRYGGKDVTARLVDELTAFERSGGRVVLVSQSGLPFDTIVPDNRPSAAALARTLVDIGYRRFAVLGHSPQSVGSSERLDGFIDGLRMLGIEVPESRILRGEDGFDSGYRMAETLVEDGLGDTELVFAVSDTLALGAMAALRARGVSTPERVGVAGYGGTSIGPYRPADQVTTVQFALRETGAQAYGLAVRSRADGERSVVSLPATIVVRGSTPGIVRD